MKLVQKVTNEQIMGAEKEMSFEIATDNSVIFDILRDKMYSNAKAAIAREVASNSRDANRESGLGDTPIDIIIAEPNEFLGISDMSIVFKDKGTGISQERMSDIFLKYGASTKRDTNGQTGGFGLGAKTPFAYSDTFTVITVVAEEGVNIKYTYSAMIDSTRKGKMILFDSEETKEETGTSIVVPIDQYDRSDFEREVYRATSTWEVRPNYCNFENIAPARLQYEGRGKTFVQDLQDDYNLTQGAGFVLLIDGIPYPISDISVIDSDLPTKLSSTVFIPFENGQLTIAANRESVQYDEETIKKIKNKLKGLDKHFKEQIKLFFKGLDTENYSWVQARFLYKEFMSCTKNSWSTPTIKGLRSIINLHHYKDSFANMIEEEFEKIGNQYPISIKRDYQFKTFSMAKVNSGYSSKYSYDNANTVSDMHKNAYVYISGEKRRAARRTESGMIESDLHNMLILNHIEIEKMKSVSDFISELYMCIDMFGWEMKFYDDLKYSIKTSDGTKSASKEKAPKPTETKIFARQWYSGTFEPSSLFYIYDFECVKLPIQINKICFYVFDGTLTTFDDRNDVGRHTTYLNSFSTKCSLLKSQLDITTFIVTEKQWNRYFKNHNYPTMEEMMKENMSVLKTYIKDQKIAQLDRELDGVVSSYLTSPASRLYKYLPNNLRYKSKGLPTDYNFLYMDIKTLDSIFELNVQREFDSFENEYHKFLLDNPIIQLMIDNYSHTIDKFLFRKIESESYTNLLKQQDLLVELKKQSCIEKLGRKNPRIVNFMNKKRRREMTK